MNISDTDAHACTCVFAFLRYWLTVTNHRWVLRRCRRAVKAGTATKTKPEYIGFRVMPNGKSSVMPVTGVNMAPDPASVSVLSNRRIR